MAKFLPIFDYGAVSSSTGDAGAKLREEDINLITANELSSSVGLDDHADTNGHVNSVVNERPVSPFPGFPILSASNASPLTPTLRPREVSQSHPEPTILYINETHDKQAETKSVPKNSAKKSYTGKKGVARAKAAEVQKLQRARAEAEEYARAIQIQKQIVFEVQMILFEGRVRDSQLLAARALLTQAEFNDVIVERAIVRSCGSPLCGNVLPENTRKGRFRVSLSKKKIYDNEETFNFCSDECMASMRGFTSSLALDREASMSMQTMVSILQEVRTGDRISPDEPQTGAHTLLRQAFDGKVAVQERAAPDEGTLMGSSFMEAGPADAIEGYVPLSRGRGFTKIKSTGMADIKTAESSLTLGKESLNGKGSRRGEGQESREKAASLDGRQPVVQEPTVTWESGNISRHNKPGSLPKELPSHPEIYTNVSLLSPEVSKSRGQQNISQSSVQQSGASFSFQSQVATKTLLNSKSALLKEKHADFSGIFSASPAGKQASLSSGAEALRELVRKSSACTSSTTIPLPGVKLDELVDSELVSADNPGPPQQPSSRPTLEGISGKALVEPVVPASQGYPDGHGNYFVPSLARYTDDVGEYSANHVQPCRTSGDSPAVTSSPSRPASTTGRNGEEDTSGGAQTPQIFNEGTNGEYAGSADTLAETAVLLNDMQITEQGGTCPEQESPPASGLLDKDQTTSTVTGKKQGDGSSVAHQSPINSMLQPEEDSVGSLDAKLGHGEVAVGMHNQPQQPDQNQQVVHEMTARIRKEDESHFPAQAMAEAMALAVQAVALGEIEEGAAGGTKVEPTVTEKSRSSQAASWERAAVALKAEAVIAPEALGLSSDGCLDDVVSTGASWHDAPPKGFRLELSSFGTLWMALEEWTSADVVTFLHGISYDPRDDGEILLGETVYHPQLILPGGVSGEIARTVSGSLARALPDTTQRLRLKAPQSRLQQALAQVVNRMSFRNALPPLGTRQWRMIGLLLLDALAVHILPGVRAQLAGEQHVLQEIVQGAGISMEQYSMFRSLLLPVEAGTSVENIA